MVDNHLFYSINDMLVIVVPGYKCIMLVHFNVTGYEIILCLKFDLKIIYLEK